MCIMKKDPLGQFYTKLFYVIIPTLFITFFLLSLHVVTVLMLFITCYFYYLLLLQTRTIALSRSEHTWD